MSVFILVQATVRLPFVFYLTFFRVCVCFFFVSSISHTFFPRCIVKMVRVCTRERERCTRLFVHKDIYKCTTTHGDWQENAMNMAECIKAKITTIRIWLNREGKNNNNNNTRESNIHTILMFPSRFVIQTNQFHKITAEKTHIHIPISIATFSAIPSTFGLNRQMYMHMHICTMRRPMHMKLSQVLLFA